MSPIEDRHPHPEIVLIGQPNCGKSTLFNSVAGYRSISTNFPGATVEYTRSHVAVNGLKCNLVDLPGIYSLIAMDRAAEEAKKYLLQNRIDLLINVIDASIASRSLELTLQLLELGKPMVICLNMMDEAERKGVEIDIRRLEQKLFVPVVPAIASQGKGIDELFAAAFELMNHPRTVPPIQLSRHVEAKITTLESHIESEAPAGFNRRLAAIKLLEGDAYIEKSLAPNESLLNKVKELQAALVEEHGDTPDAVFAAERHHLAMHIFEESATVHRRPHTRTNKIDDLLMHHFWGYALMLAILLLYFNGIFKFGAWIEAPLMEFLSGGIVAMTEYLDSAGLWAQIARAALQGIAGGIAIVLPYLLPFLIGMAIIEDVGYLPRIAFLMDSFMHRIGLHGVAVIPGLLGYGCSVPAIMATRILSSPRDRFIASVIVVLVPCSARMVVIMGLVGYYLGGTAAAGIYLFNLIVVALLGAALARMMPEDVPGMILEMPAYHRPRAKVVLLKSWLRLKDFIVIAWPLLIVGSIVLGLAEWFDLNEVINLLTRPITWLLALPEAVGVTLIFGVLRKELSLLMLFQALGTQDVAAVLSKAQILTLTLFVVFYIPCLATLGIMGREIGWKKTALVTLVAFFLSLGIALLGRSVGWVLFG